MEMIYTKFVSLISSDPIVQTLLPLTPQVRLSCMWAATCGHLVLAPSAQPALEPHDLCIHCRRHSGSEVCPSSRPTPHAHC